MAQNTRIGARSSYPEGMDVRLIGSIHLCALRASDRGAARVRIWVRRHGQYLSLSRGLVGSFLSEDRRRPGVRLHHPHKKRTSRNDRIDRLEQVGSGARRILNAGCRRSGQRTKMPMLNSIRQPQQGRLFAVKGVA